MKASDRTQPITDQREAKAVRLSRFGHENVHPMEHLDAMRFRSGTVCGNGLELQRYCSSGGNSADIGYRMYVKMPTGEQSWKSIENACFLSDRSKCFRDRIFVNVSVWMLFRATISN